MKHINPRLLNNGKTRVGESTSFSENTCGYLTLSYSYLVAAAFKYSIATFHTQGSGNYPFFSWTKQI